MAGHPSQKLSEQQIVVEHYSNRATRYDEGSGGWHIQLGRDFVDWLSPRPGSVCLDLACGTGLVTIPLMEAVGDGGTVVGVDITKEMLVQARLKPAGMKRSPIWIEGDIIHLEDVSEFMNAFEKYGGFDTISCCSAFVLLPNTRTVIQSWLRFLRPGGRLIVDVPTEDKTLQYLSLMALPKMLGLYVPFDRNWIKGKESLERLLIEAGLEIEQSFRTKSYVTEINHGLEDQEECFDEYVDVPGNMYRKQGVLQAAKEAWPVVWQNGMLPDGTVYEGQPLYVCIGRK